MIDFTKIFQLKGLKPNNNGHTNFNECCDLTKKVYLKYVMEHFSFQIGENEVRQQIGPPSIQRLYKEGREAKLEESGVGNSSEIKSLCLMKWPSGTLQTFMEYEKPLLLFD